MEQTTRREEIAANVRAAKARRRVTDAQIGEVVGVPRSGINDRMNGNARWHIEGARGGRALPGNDARGAPGPPRAGGVGVRWPARRALLQQEQQHRHEHHDADHHREDHPEEGEPCTHSRADVRTEPGRRCWSWRAA
ncbi:hypothetical protein G5V59_00395 [Nocardioides sp. W3-2-3]|uniref:hypothetical protein n=1 Tax=Nocardioides convexus TaxID=2712224 RepID=UPI0024186B1D|nr:hypothetical protein [Nocardioides convexus]NGZ99430.1 hypothetical protein [Nocardioides convexus]